MDVLILFLLWVQVLFVFNTSGLYKYSFSKYYGKKTSLFLFVTEKLFNSKPWLAEQKKNKQYRDQL